jgi:hypothetical protein
MVMKSSAAVLKAVIAGVAVLASGQAQADIVKSAVRLGAFELGTSRQDVSLTTSGTKILGFNGSGKFTIWYTAECAASGYVNVDIWVDGFPIEPTGASNTDSFCDSNTRGAMHTAMGRTHNLGDGEHSVVITAYKSEGLAFLSDSSLLIGK